ncbi:MAG: glycoside hydrolase family 9 protein, partial [Bifidobacteriaceae bacterium]|nr:glycoside hydrolase family 9 protein [Bifidobacteriaceae bacterium]
MLKLTPETRINNVDYSYLTYPGFDVFMYNNGYNGTFGDEHLSGITLVLNGQRIAGNGDIHLLPAVEQWDAAQPDNSSPINAQSPRTYNRSTNTITLPMRYVYNSLERIDPSGPNNATNWPQMQYDLIATPEPGGVNIKVVLKSDLPPQLENSASFQMEFIPSLYKNKSYQIDTDGDGEFDQFGTLPLAPEDPMDEDWPRADLKFSAWYVEQWNNEKGAQQPSPLGRGHAWALSAEDPTTKITVRSDQVLSLYDGRNRSQNGWFGMASRIPKGSKAGETVATWHITAPVEDNWTRPVSIAHNQAGYAPALPKVAVMEIDAKDTNPPSTASVLRLNADGTYTEVFSSPVGTARQWTRYNYRDFDFTTVQAPGTYVIEYDGVRTAPFPIDTDVYSNSWQTALSSFLATAMDHIEVREGYRIWHGASHMDDARVGEHFQNSIVNAQNRITWFDGQSVPMVLPQVLQDRGYNLGDRIPGLATGGWYDAGDFDIQLASNTSVLRTLITTAEALDNVGDYDTLAVEWNEDTGGLAEMHRPDGVPDIVQQVKHGAMQILANYDNVGIVQGTIEVPSLRQYTHLGEGSTDTDGYIYDPDLGEDEIVERNGVVYSGKNDDRMLMLGAGAGAPTSNIGATSITLAGAAAVTKDYYPDFAAAALAAAEEIWTDHGAWATTNNAGQRSNAFNTLAQLMLATEGTPAYAGYRAEMDALLAQNQTTNPNPFVSFLPITNNYQAVAIMDLMGPAFRQNVIDAVVGTAGTYNPVANTPFGFGESLTSGWGPISGKVGSASRAAILYATIGDVPGMEPIRDHLLRATDYLLGTHPYNDTSWLTGVGTKSHKLPYNSNRADEGFILGSIVPGYVSFRPDFPEALDNFPFLWAENEATIGAVAPWIAAGMVADQIAKQASSTTPPAQSRDFSGTFQMTAEETEAMNPYTGQPDLPYEVLTTPGFDVFMYNTTFSQIFGDQHAAGVELVLNGQRLATNGDIHLLPTPEQWDATPAPILENRASNPATNEVSATLTLPGTEDG